MSLTYGFYDSINHDRTYNAVQMAEIFDGVINDGVFMSVGDRFLTSPSSGMQVKVGTGRAWFNHTWTYSDDDYYVTIDDAEIVLTRIDAIVLEIRDDPDYRENSIKVVKGTPDVSGIRPTIINTDGQHQHVLCYITITPGMTEISQENIQNVVGLEDTPYVTSIVETTDIDYLMQTWENEFHDWITHLRDELDENQAANLQRQIDENAEATEETIANLDIFKVGDLRWSFANLGEKWLQCNGERFNDSDYPDLKYALAKDLKQTVNISDALSKIKTKFSISDTVKCFTVGGNGLKMLYLCYPEGINTPTDHKPYCRLYWTSNEEDFYCDPVDLDIENVVGNIIYNNGKWHLYYTERTASVTDHSVPKYIYWNDSDMSHSSKIATNGGLSKIRKYGGYYEGIKIENVQSTIAFVRNSFYGNLYNSNYVSLANTGYNRTVLDFVRISNSRYLFAMWDGTQHGGMYFAIIKNYDSSPVVVNSTYNFGNYNNAKVLKTQNGVFALLYNSTSTTFRIIEFTNINDNVNPFAYTVINDTLTIPVPINNFRIRYNNDYTKVYGYSKSWDNSWVYDLTDPSNVRNVSGVFIKDDFYDATAINGSIFKPYNEVFEGISIDNIIIPGRGTINKNDVYSYGCNLPYYNTPANLGYSSDIVIPGILYIKAKN